VNWCFFHSHWRMRVEACLKSGPWLRHRGSERRLSLLRNGIRIREEAGLFVVTALVTMVMSIPRMASILS